MVQSSNIYYSKVYQKGNWKEKIQFPPEQWKKLDFPDTETLLGCFRHRHSIKLFKNKIDSNIIKSHQFSLEISHAVLIEY